LTAGIGPERLAARVAAELAPGRVASLAPGLPRRVADHLSSTGGVVLLSEDGLLTMGPGTVIAVLDQADARGLVRGGYLDTAVVEGVQVSGGGNVAVRAGGLRAISGGDPAAAEAMARARRVVVMMEHTGSDGSPRIVESPTHPPSGRAHLIVTDLAVLEVSDEGLVLRELAPGWTVDRVRALTGAPLIPAADLVEMDLSPTGSKAPSKVFQSAADAVADIPQGAVVMLGGFGGPGGMAQGLVLALRDQGAGDLTLISNTAGIARVANFGTPSGFTAIDHSILVENGQIRKAVASFPVSPSPSRPSPFEEAYRAGRAELELAPQGTLAERIRAGGLGLAGFYTPTGAGTPIAEGKETRTFDGMQYVLEWALRADYALLRAHKADTLGNLVYRGTSRNFNATMAPAADVTIVEVDEIVQPGELDPEAVVTPCPFVQRIVVRPPGFVPYTRDP
jgi:3-oxoacid CoA-transferase A subunit